MLIPLGHGNWDCMLRIEANMSRGQRIARIVFPIMLVLSLFSFGTIVLGSLSLQGRAFWFWPVALLFFASLWWVSRKHISGWFSPNVFLVMSIPIFGLFLAIYIVIPHPSEPIEWIPADKRQLIDLSSDFNTLDGQTVSLTAHRNQVLFLNVWATWCGPCRAEMPDMAALYKELSDEGLAMVAVTNEDPQTVSHFLKKNPYPFTILLDPAGTLDRQFDLYVIPTTFVIDRQGRIALRRIGCHSWGSSGSVQRFRQLLSVSSQ
jgi:thiol-disulfide isomerase/thioredoxin